MLYKNFWVSLEWNLTTAVDKVASNKVASDKVASDKVVSDKVASGQSSFRTK